VILALYVGAHAMVWQDVTVLGAFIILGVITTAGELTQHWGWYVTLHSIWHVGVFRLAGHVLILAESAPASERWVWQQGPAIGPTILLATVLTISLVLVVAVVFHPPWLTPVLERVLPPMVMRIPPQPADNGQEKVLYLTFDDGPTDWMDRIIDTIKHSPYGNDAGATFFVVGENIQSFLKAREYTRGNAVMMNAYNDRLRTIDRNVSHVNPINLDERKSNYSLANHMMLQERAALKLSTNAFLNSLTQTDRLIQYHPSDEKTRRWVRPASGLATREQIQVANTAGYCVVLGSVHPFEAKPAWFWRWAWRLAVWHLKLWFTQIDHATYGCPIVILHEREWTSNVLAEILPWWYARGWQIRALPSAATVN
jgi:peptidoglycan/xylan/chitin deacetylase (PgdA/CDA1 family)